MVTYITMWFSLPPFAKMYFACVMQKNCAVSQKTFEITQRERDLYDKLGVPVPALCPDERMRCRMAFRNERELYRRKCDLCQRKIVSIYHAESPHTVYCQECFWGDGWDPAEHAQDFDFSRDFFSQFAELMAVVPRLAIQNKESYNSEYNNYSLKNKNCYLTFGMHYNEDVSYSQYGIHSRTCGDCFRIGNCELCYECTECRDCYNARFLQNCVNCSDSSFLLDCIGCKDCFGCLNLRNKQYYFLNEKCTKEQYEEKLKALEMEKFSNLKNLRASFEKFCQGFPHKFMQGVQNENAVGDYINNCREVYDCFDTQLCEHCLYAGEATNVKTGCDMTCMGYDASELCYQTCGGAGLFDCKACDSCWHDSNCEYCNLCFSSQDLFGCISMRNAKYSIFNKTYSKEEYEALRTKIVEHMKSNGEYGRFFPIEISAFAYNESLAQWYFPLEKEDVLDRGWKWKDRDKRDFQPQTYSLPDSIDDVPDSVTDEILACQTCTKNYRIQKSELKFHRQMGLPLPRYCSDCRHGERMKLRNQRQLYHRQCDECETEFQTTFAPERPEKVLCEDCYLRLVD